ncbi:hypothetical protein SAV31267_077890 [Streptomyces avermitilis]|uniref:Major facilitator superfamily (MFS) profile domain-containing protein n=1 Tax=Streptomyces avermitilis TaxID=33903 RepID=A0A4D4N2S7_STRAX|nr:hypothetical protein SAV31267_077890 [Streptomyces avermitilis]
MRTWGPLTAVCLGTFMLLLDVTIAVVALPDMARALHASLSDLQWVMDGYALALAALLLGLGAAADVLGRRRVHVAGVVLFAVASLLCGLASGRGCWSPRAGCRESGRPRCSRRRCRCWAPSTRVGGGRRHSACGVR